MPSLCLTALSLLSDLCPTNYADLAPRYVAHPPQYIPPSPPFPAPAECHANGGPCVVGAGMVGAPIEIHTNCGMTGNMVFAAGQPTVCGTYTVATPASAAKIHIVASPSSEELEINAGGSCIHCKKMTVTIGENEIAVSRFEDRVRIRGDKLKATAARVRSDSKDRLILEGDAVLHYKKDSHSANITGEHIELNLYNGTVTVHGIKTLSSPAAHIDR